MSDRFFGQDIRDAVARLTRHEHDHLSDDDYVAVLEEVGDKKVVRLALVERLLRAKSTSKGNQSLEDASRVATDDPSGRLVLRMLQPVSQGTTSSSFFVPT